MNLPLPRRGLPPLLPPKFAGSHKTRPPLASTRPRPVRPRAPTQLIRTVYHPSPVSTRLTLSYAMRRGSDHDGLVGVVALAGRGRGGGRPARLLLRQLPAAAEGRLEGNRDAPSGGRRPLRDADGEDAIHL